MAICRSCDKIGHSVTNSVTKMKPDTSSVVIKSLFFGLKEKERHFRGLRKSVTAK